MQTPIITPPKPCQYVQVVGKFYLIYLTHLGIDHANDRYGDALHLHRLGLRQVAQRPLAGTGSALCSLHSGLLVFGSANVVELRMQRLK